MSDAETVLGFPGFFRVERCHLGHMGPCPDGHVSEYDGLPCWRFDVGVSLRVGVVDWWHGATWEEAISQAANAIRKQGGAQIDLFAPAPTPTKSKEGPTP